MPADRGFLCAFEAELNDITNIAEINVVSSFMFDMYWAATINMCDVKLNLEKKFKVTEANNVCFVMWMEIV